MDKDFLSSANIKRNEYLLNTEVLFVANKTRWFSDFSAHFQTLCAQIRKWQDASILPAISYLEYTMLYTNFINRHYISDILVYGDKSYLDKNQRTIGSYDVSFLFIIDYHDENCA